MTSPFATELLDTFAEMKAEWPESVVSVMIGAETSEGLLGPESEQPNPDNVGENGIRTRRLRMPILAGIKPVRGTPMKVGNADVTVTDIQADSVNQLWRIDFQYQRPLVGV